MAFKKGDKKPANSGKKKGSVNKYTADLKGMILQALDESGGVSYLKAQAVATPQAFIGLIGKVLPTTLIGDKENPLQHNVSISITPVRPSLK